MSREKFPKCQGLSLWEGVTAGDGEGKDVNKKKKHSDTHSIC